MAAAATDHAGQHESGQPHRGDEVEGDDPVEVAVRRVDERSPAADAGVVDEDVDAAELAADRGERLLELRRVGEVGDGDRDDGGTAETITQRRQLLSRTGDEPDPGAALDGSDGDRPSDAP